MCAASRASTPCRTSPRSCARRSSSIYSLARPEIVTEQVSVDGTRKWLLRLATAGHEPRAPEIETVYIPEADRGTLVHLEPGRLHADLHLLPHRHAAARAQPRRRRRSSARSCSRATASATGAEPPVPKTGGSSPKASARSPTSCSWAWASRSTTSTTLRRRSRSPPTAKGSRSPSAASRCRPPASCPRSRAGARNPAPCSRSRCTPRAMSCATSSCPSTASIRSPS